MRSFIVSSKLFVSNQILSKLKICTTLHYSLIIYNKITEGYACIDTGLFCIHFGRSINMMHKLELTLAYITYLTIVNVRYTPPPYSLHTLRFSVQF